MSILRSLSWDDFWSIRWWKQYCDQSGARISTYLARDGSWRYDSTWNFSSCNYTEEISTCVERFQELPKAQVQEAEVGRSYCEASDWGGQLKVREKEQQELLWSQGQCDRRLKGESVYFQKLKAEEDCPRVQRQGPRRQEHALQGNLIHLQQRGA